MRNQSLSNLDNLRNLVFYIEKWFVCFNIFPKIEYLENIINHFSGLVKEGWVDIEILDFAGNYKIIDKFNVVDKINYYNKIIKNIKPNYKVPEILGCEENKYPPIPLHELYKFKTQREITKREISEKALPSSQNIIEMPNIVEEKSIQTIEELLSNSDLFKIYQSSFVKSLVEDWKVIFNHEKCF